MFFWDLISLGPGLGTELIWYWTASPMNTPVQTTFFEDFIVRWTREGASRRCHLLWKGDCSPGWPSEAGLPLLWCSTNSCRTVSRLCPLHKVLNAESSGTETPHCVCTLCKSFRLSNNNTCQLLTQGFADLKCILVRRDSPKLTRKLYFKHTTKNPSNWAIGSKRETMHQYVTNAHKRPRATSCG